MASNTLPLRLLSLDGGGVRGYTSLLILKEIFKAVEAEAGRKVMPYELFDLIGGTSTGGLIAIMLGRLHLSIDECLHEYKQLAPKIFTRRKRQRCFLKFPTAVLGKPWFEEENLREAVHGLLERRHLDAKLPFKETDEAPCKAFVCVARAETVFSELLRSYETRVIGEQSYDCTVVEAARATTAAPLFFKPATIKVSGATFVDGAVRANNPIQLVVDEAERIWPNRRFGCLVSVGTGWKSVKPIAVSKPKLHEIFKTLTQIAMDANTKAREFAKTKLGRQLQERGRYFRFFVSQGLEDIDLASWEKFPWMEAVTVPYLSDNAPIIMACGKSLVYPTGLGDHVEPISMFPFAQNEGIIQRQAFNKLAKMLTTSNTYQSVAIWGLGGCGWAGFCPVEYLWQLTVHRKTQVALEYAYRRQQETACSVFWVHGDSEATFSLDYTHIAKKAGLSAELKGEELLHAVRQWIERQKNWLLILDNVDDLRLFLKGFSRPQAGDYCISRPELFRFIPTGTTGTILWTSRDKDIVGTLVDVEHGVHVAQMTEPEGLALLRRLTRSPYTGTPSAAEQNLVYHLGCLPLAIVQAATYIRKTVVSVEEYLTKLESSEERESRLLDREFVDRHRRSEVPNSVMQTWLISMEQISRDCPDGETILRTAAFWDHLSLPLDLLRLALGTDADDDDVTEAVSRLESLSFLQRRRTESSGVPTYDIHRLVQLAIRNSMNASQRDFFAGRALGIIADVFPDGFYPTWDRCKMYLAHALKASQWPEAEIYRSNVSKLLYNVSSYFYWNGRFTEAVELQLRVLSILKEMGQDEDPATLRIMSRLGANYRQLGQFRKGEELLLRTVDLQKKVMGDRHPDTLATMSYVATLYQHQGRLDEAEKLENEVLDLRKVVLQEHHQDIIRSMANIATIYQMQGRYDEAERLKTQVLGLRKTVLGEEHPETLKTMNNLVNAYRMQDRLSEAEELGGRTLELQRRVLGEQHPDTLRSIVSLAKTYQKQARFREAEQLELQVLKLQNATLGAEHPSTLKSMARLVTLHEKQGRLTEAVELQVRLLDLQKEVLGNEHQDTRDSMQKLRTLMETAS